MKCLWGYYPARTHFDDHSQGLWNNKDIREDDGSIQIESSEWLHRHFASQFRSPAHGEEIVLLADFLKLWQIPAGLPHHPHGYTVYRFAPSCSQKIVILQIRECLQFRIAQELIRFIGKYSSKYLKRIGGHPGRYAISVLFHVLSGFVS